MSGREPANGNTEKSCVGAAGGPWGLAVVCGLPEVEALFNVKNSGKTAEFHLQSFRSRRPFVCANSRHLLRSKQASRQE